MLTADLRRGEASVEVVLDSTRTRVRVSGWWKDTREILALDGHTCVGDSTYEVVGPSRDPMAVKTLHGSFLGRRVVLRLQDEPVRGPTMGYGVVVRCQVLWRERTRPVAWWRAVGAVAASYEEIDGELVVTSDVNNN